MNVSHILYAPLALIATFFPTQAQATDCQKLSSLALPNTEITTAQRVSAGAFTPPYGGFVGTVPSFCRVAGVIKPTADSYIRFEVWLPEANWNFKFLAAGNGGFAGSIDYRTLAANLNRGYATAVTDTGHEGEAQDASWAFKHPEKVADFGYRALHETTIKAKLLITALYGRPPQHSYFASCSNGGREALIEAQRFPEDFDGILAGAPAYAWTNLLVSAMSSSQAMLKDPASYISTLKIPAIGKAVLSACDAQDGVTDGVVSDPLACKFNPALLRCVGPEARTCLTEPQIAALHHLYAGTHNAAGTKIFPGLEPGGEEGSGGWAFWLSGPGPGGGSLYPENFFRYMVFDDPTWNLLTANIDEASRAALQKTGSVLNATSPNLEAFKSRGGKLILYHGWNDPAIPPLSTVNYYGSVASHMGAQPTQEFVRLYMVPGMQHCAGGPGASAFGQGAAVTAIGPKYGIYNALEQWTENGTAPSDIVATKYVADNPDKGVQMTRPLCPYPDAAKYKGSGDVNSYANFSCIAPPK